MKAIKTTALYAVLPSGKTIFAINLADGYTAKFAEDELGDVVDITEIDAADWEQLISQLKENTI